ncbi:FAD-binding oxidoreductase [Acidisoma cellulosilytica]|uniref:FAD-binding oxidoreductase n=1 Tax=Acidisoma cellulosilyticum TaxID=2802395 RepID=A0A963Z3V3_9PROT|nr:FAD-binding oxidoreductase [Acidisoma cellulosilyticum]MCB8881540.1 FAD-binding oxidoreductase [Acidisoma cellulosilyticum]
MGPYVDSVTYDEVLPERASVVVIGGGIIGTSAAFTLASRGISVVLCEKGHIAGEQSSRNWGWVRQAGRDFREMPLIVESLRLWRGLDRQIGAETGFRECGVLYVGETEDDERNFSNWMEMASPYQIGARMVRGVEMEALMPGSSQKFRCGMHVPTDGCAEPQKAAPAIARAAQEKGATILGHCAVRGLEKTAGRVSAVVTERGRIACDAVILAGGAWSGLFCASLGIRLPQLKVLSSVMRTAPVENGPEPCTWMGEIGYRKRRDGGYTIAHGSGHVTPIVPDSFRYLREFWPNIKREGMAGIRPRFNALSRFEFTTPRRWSLDRPSPFEQVRVLDPKPNKRLNDSAMETMRKLYPAFRDVPVVQEWGGYIDVTPDIVPYIGAAEDLPGLVVATGFSGHGFGIGPGAGRLAADIAMNETPFVDPTDFRLTRFSDGSPIVLGAEL